MAENVIISVRSDAQGFEESTAKIEDLRKHAAELQQKLDTISKQRTQWEGSAKAVAEFDKEIAATTNELEKTKKSIDELSNAQKKMPGKVIAENAEKSFRSMRRELEENIKAAVLAGKTGTAEFREWTKQAAELNDIEGDVRRQITGMASDTYVFDTILEGTQLAAGGFSVMQGAMAMFGAESEEAQQVMVKLQSAIAITTGLQQVQNAVQKESNLMRTISNVQTMAAAKAQAYETTIRAVNIAYIRAQNAGETANIVLKARQVIATKAATAAQWLFNAAANANPLGLLITAIGLAVTGYMLFSKWGKSAAEMQKNINETQKSFLENAQISGNELKRQAEEREKALQNEIDLMKARGASQAEIDKLEKEYYAERVKNTQEQLGFYAEEVANLEANRKKVVELTKELNNLNDAKRTGSKYTEIVVNGRIEKVKIDDWIEKTQAELDNYTLRVNVGTKAKEDAEAAKKEQTIAAAEAAKRGLEIAKASAQAAADYRVLAAKKGSEEELQAQKEALKVSLQNELNNVDITANERKLKQLQYEKNLEKLDTEYRKSRLQTSLNDIDGQLATEEDFNTNVLNLRIRRLEVQKQMDLADAKDDASKRYLIEQNHTAALTSLYEEYNKNLAERESNITQSNLNARLSGVKARSQAEHDIRVQILKETAATERETANLTIKNEEERAAKIKEINARLKRDLQDLDVEYIKTYQEATAEQVLAATQDYKNRKISHSEFTNQVNQITIKGLQDEIAKRESMGENVIALRQELAEKEIEIEERKQEAIKQLASDSFNAMTEWGSAFFDIQQQNLSQQLADYQHYYTTDAEAAKKNTSLKLVSQQEYDRKTLEIRRKQAQSEKNQAIFQANIDTAKAILSIWAEYAAMPYVAAAMTAIALIAMGAQIAAINSQQLPKYAKGRKGGKGEFALVGEAGPEIIWVPASASIMPNRDMQRAFAGKVEAFDRWNMPRLKNNVPDLPIIQQNVISNMQGEQRGYNIDYDLLGRSVAKHIKFPKQRDVSVHFDKSGLKIEDGNTTIRYLNAKYSR
ncbi:MAG: hypothetical protein LBR64_02230 [Dysgonamonadaceae bacterium]|jgi:hypothetical protein|nr:hypothetical protein [Dysgonamonadaceae bacterium]